MNLQAKTPETSWRALPLDGVFTFLYCDEAGHVSRRRLFARELKVSPGKTLLGGVDRAIDAYRGFRADRIEYLVDDQTGEVVRRNVIDWLLKRAIRQARTRGETRRAA